MGFVALALLIRAWANYRPALEAEPPRSLSFPGLAHWAWGRAPPGPAWAGEGFRRPASALLDPVEVRGQDSLKGI